MSDQELDDVLSSLDKDKCIEFFSKMDERQRKSYAPRALLWLTVSKGCNLSDPEMKWYTRGASWAPKRIHKLFAQEDEAKRLAKQLPKVATTGPAIAPATIAVFSTAGFTEVKKLDATPAPEDVYRLIADRKPRWTENFVRYVFEKNPAEYWSVVRSMERDGLVELEHDSSFLGAMAVGLGRLREPDTIVQFLRDDPTLLEKEVWRMLEDDAAMRLLLTEFQMVFGQHHFSNIPEARWHTALCELTETDEIDKERLLNITTSTLARLALENSDGTTLMNPHWWIHLHKELKPDIEQHLDLFKDYLSLLRSRSLWAVPWAIEMIEAQSDKVYFPLDAACADLGEVFFMKGKEVPLKAIACLKTIAEKQVELRPDVALCAAEALSHTSAEIQKQGIMLIEKYGDKKDSNLVDRLKLKMEYASVLNRDRLNKWLPALMESGSPVSTTLAGGGAGATEAGGETCSPGIDISEQILFLKESTRDFPEKWLKITAMQSAFDALEGKAIDLECAEFDGDEFPRLDDEKKLKSVEDLDELVFLLAPYFQGSRWEQDDSEDFELILDGVSRLNNKRPADFEMRVNSIANGQGSPLMQMLVSAWLSKSTGLAQIFQLVDQSVEGNPIQFIRHRSAPADELLERRFSTVSRRVARGVSARLLATPTHKGGWIDPLVLVQRVMDGIHNVEDVPIDAESAKSSVVDHLQQLITDGLNPFLDSALKAFRLKPAAQKTPIDDGHVEQSLALLRLAPDHRQEALEKLDSAKLPSGEFLDALRYALGAEDVKIGKSAPLWVAAARSRAAFKDDARVEERFPNLGPDCGRVTRYSLSLTEQQLSRSYRGFVFQLLCRQPEYNPGNRTDICTLALHYRADDERFVTYYMYRGWLSAMWPLCLEPFFAIGAEHMADNSSSSETAGTGIFFEKLYDPDVPAKPMAMLCIALGLTGKAQDENGAAIEALIQCIDDGRVNGNKLGQILRSLAFCKVKRGNNVSLITLQRWAKALRTVAQTSSYHARVVALAIETVFHGDPKNAPKDLHCLLEVLLELLTREHQAISLPATREYIGGLKTTGKTGQLTKQLLGLKPDALTNQKLQEAFLYAANQRIDRLQRWSNRVKQDSASSKLLPNVTSRQTSIG